MLNDYSLYIYCIFYIDGQYPFNKIKVLRAVNNVVGTIEHMGSNHNLSQAPSPSLLIV